MPRNTLWELQPHTGAKHALLRAYLNAWFPILGSWAGRVLFIDGFAGPGQYQGGEPGSPLVALEAARNHQSRLANRELGLVFIELERPRYDHLSELIDAEESAGRIPPNIKCSVYHGAFADVVGSGLDSLGGNALAPALVMIDPFGVKGVPYGLIQRLASYPQSELLISFMQESMVRWASTDGFEPHLDELFGCRDWRDARAITHAGKKSAFLHDLFKTQLQAAGMDHVLSFRMIDDRGHTEYFLFFATHHMRGVEAMKDAMWFIDPSGAYRFSDATDPNQLVLIKPEPDFTHLRSAVAREFTGRTAGIRQIEDFVTTQTMFRKQDLRDYALKPMEDDAQIDVTGRTKRRTYPKGSEIKFN